MTRLALLAALAVAVGGCADPLSCEALNGRQSDAPASCVALGVLDGDLVTLPIGDGPPLEAHGLPSYTAARTFLDGVTISGTGDGLSWGPGRIDSIGAVAGVVASPRGGRYAAALGDGRLLLRSRDGSDPVDIPIGIETMQIGEFEFPYDVRLAFSADGARVAVGDGTPQAFVVDAQTGERLWQTDLGERARAVGLSADGRTVAVASGKEVAVWAVTGAHVATWIHHRSVADVTFHDGHVLAWLSERTSTRRESINDDQTTVGANQSIEVTETTPPAVVAWRLP